MPPFLLPSIDLERIYGPGIVLVGRASPNACRWLPDGPGASDMASGGRLTISGKTPTLCSAGVATPGGLRLLAEAGFFISGDLYRYGSVGDYLSQLRRIVDLDRTIVPIHNHPVSEIPSEKCWVSPDVIAFVNNKANLGRLVDEDNLPERRIIQAARIEADISPEDLPLVLKAATDEPTGGGCDVVICREKKDLRKATVLFACCSRVVAEKYFVMTRSFCLNYAVDAIGRVLYLGCAEQVCNTQGKYLGNWLGDDVTAPDEAVEIGKRIAEKAFRLGYHGHAGMDVGILETGQILVFDLNFRFNGSTPSLLLYDSVKRHYNQPVMRLRILQGKGSFDDLLKAAGKAVQRGIFLPLCIFDPGAAGFSGLWPVVRGLVMGKTRDDVFEREREMAHLDFVI